MAVAKTSRQASGGLDLLKAEFNRQELLTKVSAVLPGCEVGKNGLPILKTIRLRIKDGLLELVATDLNILLRATLPVSVIGEAALCVPGKLFQELLAKLNEPTVTVIFQYEAVRVEVPGAKFKMAALSVEDFPTFEEHQGGWCKLSNTKGALAQMMRLALKGVTTDESRFSLAGAQFELEPQAQRLISTNGHRLFFLEQAVPCDTQTVRSCLLPIKALKEFGKLTAETWEFALSDNHVFVRAGEVEIRCRLNTGQFPNYQNVLPKHTNVLKLEAGLFVQIARRMLSICDGDEGGVKLEARANTLYFSTNNQAGWSATDSLPVEQTGGELLTKLAAKYLLGLFEEAGDGTALLRYAESQQVIEMNLASDVWPFTARYIVMPMALGE